MVLLSTNGNSRIIEIDQSLFGEVKEFLLRLSKKEKKQLSYIDEMGDKVVVIDGIEYIEPTKEDIEAIYRSETSDFVDEEEAKRLLSV